MTNCVSDTEFPALSVAVQVTIVSPKGKTSGASLVTDDIPDISSTVDSPKSSIMVSTAVASISISFGINKIGFDVSTMETTCLLVDMLPDSSVAVQVTIVSPNGITSGASLVMLTCCKSEICGITNGILLPVVITPSRETSVRKISGGTVSTTIILCNEVAILPDESAAIHVTIVSPSGKYCGESLDMNSIFTSSNTSGSISEILFSVRLIASIIMSSGISILGGIESMRVIFCSIVEIFFITSVAVQVTIVSPKGKTSGALFSIAIIPTASEAYGISSSTRFCVSDFASNVISGNCSISGNVVS